MSDNINKQVVYALYIKFSMAAIPTVDVCKALPSLYVCGLLLSYDSTRKPVNKMVRMSRFITN